MWLIICGVLIVMEMSTVSLTTIWFAGGAFIAFIVQKLGFGFTGQLLVFAIVSLVLLIFTRPIVKKHLNTRTTRTNVEAMEGKTGVVTEKISNLKDTGLVRVAGQIWTARSHDDGEEFEKGDQVQVLRVSGVKLIVKRLEDDSFNGYI
ncbi:MAG: NfeD family protein [Lachnospiraceae bacterium]|nr:NfeD family protein [Lachnospiraceae bacterium]